MKVKKKQIESSDLKEIYNSNSERFLILHNDDINTFDYVIETLIHVCNHDQVQAEQCTFIVHYKGKCDIKKGTFYFLKPLKEELRKKGLKATID